MQFSNQSAEFDCEVCSKPHISYEALKKHRQRNHQGQYGTSLIKLNNNELRAIIKSQSEQIEDLKEQLNQKDLKVKQRITDLQKEITALKNELAKLGKKKCSQAKVEISTQLQKNSSQITQNYAAYNLDLFDSDHMDYLNSELCEQYADIVIADCPFSDTMIDFNYSVINDKKLMTLEIEKVQKTGLLYFWVTNKKLEFGLEFFKKHRYTYVDMIIWVKVDDNGNFVGGPGYYLDHQFEICLIGKKGKFHFDNILHLYPNIIKAKRREASRKPDQLYHIIKKMVPDARIIEFFARTHNIMEGIISVGDQIEEAKWRELEYGYIV